jgi:hypothetical protein
MTDSLPVLLHAAARGARLEIWSDLASKWVENEGMRPFKDEKWHIHPKDQHLRYGPISSVLYEAAKNPPEWYAQLPFGGEFREDAALELIYKELKRNQFNWRLLSPTEKSVFLLFVAESLIEDGL